MKSHAMSATGILLLLVATPGCPDVGAPPADVGTSQSPPEVPREALEDPDLATVQAPETYKVKFDTSKGSFVVEVTRRWAPLGADRFYNLVGCGYFEGVRFFRVVSGFMVQFGIHGNADVNRRWTSATFDDEPVRESNRRGFMTFAKTGRPNSRTTQIFINFGDNSRLDGMGFAPFGRVVEGMEVVDSLHSGYGDGPSQGGNGPDQGRMARDGNAYLAESFPKLDLIKKATVVE